eukprot:COSAG02_NODE_1660_length_11449_cov_6.953128_4_plen_78_part_00
MLYVRVCGSESSRIIEIRSSLHEGVQHCKLKLRHTLSSICDCAELLQNFKFAHRNDSYTQGMPEHDAHEFHRRIHDR